MKTLNCQPLTAFPVHSTRSLKYFFTDIDDTLSTDGQITSEAYSALWDLTRAGVHVIPVTGRPAGWCDMIARMWPVEAVIGENGAFSFSYNRKTRTMKRSLFQSKADREKGKQRLDRLQQRVLNEIPGVGISADQPYRFADLAIDFCEDVEPLSDTAIQKICSIARELGLTYKVSSIHVNCWYGKFNKVSCMKNFLKEHYTLTLEHSQEKIVFMGDSPNDEPMFAEVKQSIAVANIRKFLPSLKSKPAYITEKPSGDGFQEAVTHILSLRHSR